MAYAGWVRRFVVFHGMRHPRTLGPADVSRFLSSLASHGVAASTQNQALGALLFLYQTVLRMAVPELRDVARAKGRNACRWSCRAGRWQVCSDNCTAWSG